MFDFSMTAGRWNWRVSVELTVEQALMLVERAVIVAKTVGYWSRNGSGEFQMMEFIAAARTKQHASVRSYEDPGWSGSNGRGKAQAALGSAALFLEAWATDRKLDAERVNQYRSAVVYGLAHMCDMITTYKPSDRFDFPRYMDAVFGDLAEVRPI